MTEIGETGPSRDVRTIGEEPKPRALLSWEGPDGDRVAEVLALHAPTVRPIRELAGVRQDDYDLLVTNRMNALTDYGSNKFEPESALFVIRFAGGEQGNWGTADVTRAPHFLLTQWHSGFLSKSVDVPSDLLSAAADLVHDDLILAAMARESHIRFEVHDRSAKVHRSPGPPILSSSPAIPASAPATEAPPAGNPVDDGELQPFLLTAGMDPQVLAGWYRRSDTSEAWLLPSDVKRPWDWVAAAIQHWAITYGRFPLVGGWWRTRCGRRRPRRRRLRPGGRSRMSWRPPRFALRPRSVRPRLFLRRRAVMPLVGLAGCSPRRGNHSRRRWLRPWPGSATP